MKATEKGGVHDEEDPDKIAGIGFGK